MKGKKFYFILTAILLIGVSSIYFFRQQREEQFLAFEAYEIENIESQVLSLYNEEKTDIKSNLSENTFEEIQALFDELETEEYHPKNAERLEKAQNDFITAKEMHHLEETIDNLFIEDEMIDPEVSTQKIEQLENELLHFQEKEVYYARHMENLSEAKVQLHNIEIARSFIEGLFEEDMVREDVTRADEEEALAFIENIKNDEVRDELLAQVEILSVALTEAEEALALEEALLEEEALEEAETIEEENQYSSSADTEWNANSSGSWNSQGNTGNSSGSENAGSGGYTNNQGSQGGGNSTAPSQNPPAQPSQPAQPNQPSPPPPEGTEEPSPGEEESVESEDDENETGEEEPPSGKETEADTEE